MTATNQLIRLAQTYKDDIQIYEQGEIPLEYLFTGTPETGETLLFAHSLSTNIKQFLPHVAHFSKRYSVLCLSFRGHGNSGRPVPESSENYSRAKVVEDVKRLVDSLGIQQFHYVGNSFGGVIGYEYLRRYPESLKSLTTLCSPAQASLPYWISKAFIMGYWSALSAVQIPALEHLIVNTVIKQVCKTPDSQEFLVKELLREINLKATSGAQQDLTHFSYLEELKSFPRPVLLLNGEEDRVINFIMRPTREVCKSNPNIRQVTLKGAGHLANLDCPDEFNRALDNFYGA
ncbi:alpha/beta hydrolase [Deltaproteobacteria bacterium TL4]